MTRRLVEKHIKKTENCVRCLLHSMHVKGSKNKLQDAALIPKPNDINVSMLREDYTTESDIVQHGKNVAKGIPSNPPQEFRGLLYLTQNIVNSTNSWLHTRFAKLEGVDNLPEEMSRLRYAPMYDNINYAPIDVDLYTDTPGVALPHHADLRYSRKNTIDCQTEIRQYGREMMKRAKYKFIDDNGDWQEKQVGEYAYFNSEPLLSIIVPFFNDKDYIEKCARSIFDEVRGKSVEVIFVGDSPNDGTAKIVERLVSEHPDCSYMYGQEHGGQGKARNEGLKVARGKFVWFVDADDTITSGSVEGILNQLDDSCDTLLFRTEERNDDGSRRDYSRRYMKCKDGVIIQGIDVMIKHLSFAPSLMFVFRRDFLQKSNLEFDDSRNLDLYFMPRCMVTANRVKICPEVIYTYYFHHGKRKYGQKDTQEMLRMYQEYEDICKQNTHDNRLIKAIAYAQQVILSHIIQDPSPNQFEKNYNHYHLKERILEFRNTIKRSGYMGKGFTEHIFWVIAWCNLKWANRFSKWAE